jgi:hypothetical protein
MILSIGACLFAFVLDSSLVLDPSTVAWAQPIVLQLTEERADPKFGLNRPLLARTADGTKMVAKRNVADEIGQEQALKQDRNGILASQLLAAIDLPCVESYQAKWLSEDRWVTGCACAWVDGALTLVEFPASRISNPDEAVALVIWRELLGDGDINGTNFLVEVDSGKLWAIDLDKAFFGIYPNKSSGFQEIMGWHATPARVDPVLQRIGSMDREQFRELLDRVGPRALQEWSTEIRDEALECIMQNRATLLAGNPYTRFYGRKSPTWFCPEPIRYSQGDSRVRDSLP